MRVRILPMSIPGRLLLGIQTETSLIRDRACVKMHAGTQTSILVAFLVIRDYCKWNGNALGARSLSGLYQFGFGMIFKSWIELSWI